MTAANLSERDDASPQDEVDTVLRYRPMAEEQSEQLPHMMANMSLPAQPGGTTPRPITAPVDASRFVPALCRSLRIDPQQRAA